MSGSVMSGSREKSNAPQHMMLIVIIDNDDYKLWDGAVVTN